MIIPQKTRDSWKELTIRGDQTEMSQGDDTLRRYISVALNGGNCTEDTFKIIRDFYNARKKLLETA